MSDLSQAQPASAAEWDEWLSLFASRNEVAVEYADLLRRYRHVANFKAINEAILRRWSPAGLTYIKERAWKLYERSVVGEEEK